MANKKKPKPTYDHVATKEYWSDGNAPDPCPPYDDKAYRLVAATSGSTGCVAFYWEKEL